MKIRNSIKNRGMKETFRLGILKILKMNKIQEEIDSLYYFLNNYTDITHLPPTSDEDLRLLQEGLTAFLELFDALCNKHGLTYWLTAGSLLGAVRHKGFIPWDDDVDVCMLREDYNKILNLFNEDLKSYGIVIREGGYFDNRGFMQRLAMSYKTLETGLWLDIFPVDAFYINDNINPSERDLIKAMDEYRTVYHRIEGKKSVEDITRRKEELFKNHKLYDGNNKVFVVEMEFTNSNYIFREEEIFPLNTAIFENITCNIPANAEQYLRKAYGEGFMNFPRTGTSPHCDPDGQAAKSRARRHNIDMNEVIDYLQKIKVRMNDKSDAEKNGYDETSYQRCDEDI